MANENVKCPVCGRTVMRSSSGILAHTTEEPGQNAAGKYQRMAVVCAGSKRGARPD